MTQLESQISQTVVKPKKDTTRKHIRGSSLLLFGRFVSLGLNFLVQILTVRYLSKQDFGAFSYGLSIVSLGASVSLFGLDKAVSRFVPIYQEHGRFQRVIGSLLLMGGSIVD
jgi:O-antigen/teichoic acid export membrane protein